MGHRAFVAVGRGATPATVHSALVSVLVSFAGVQHCPQGPAGLRFPRYVRSRASANSATSSSGDRDRLSWLMCATTVAWCHIPAASTAAQNAS
jgi:hypothetical protein